MIAIIIKKNFADKISPMKAGGELAKIRKPFMKGTVLELMLDMVTLTKQLGTAVKSDSSMGACNLLLMHV